MQTRQLIMSYQRIPPAASERTTWRSSSEEGRRLRFNQRHGLDALTRPAFRLEVIDGTRAPGEVIACANGTSAASHKTITPADEQESGTFSMLAEVDIRVDEALS